MPIKSSLILFYVHSEANQLSEQVIKVRNHSFHPSFEPKLSGSRAKVAS